MPYAGFELNSKHPDPWVIAIGKFMINFGSVEWLTFLWLEALAKDVILKEVAVEMPLSRRIEVIRKLLEQCDIPKKVFNDSKAAWGTVEKLAKLRNDIAHNPIIFGWHGPEEARPPDFIGSMNFKKLKNKQPLIAPLLELQVLNRGIDNAAHVAQRLHDLLVTVKAAIDEP